MVNLFKWLAKIAILVWLIVVVIAMIGCYNIPDEKLDEPPKVEVRENTKEKEIDISFFKWIRSE